MKNYLLSAVAATMVLTACQDQKKEEEQMLVETTQNNSEPMSLQAMLDEKKEGWQQKADTAVKRIYAEGIASVENSGILQSAKQVGQKAPDFALKNATGETVTLADYLKKGPVVLTWYRGGWCPYCNITLARMQEELPKFKAAGANLLALTPELPDKSMTTKEKHQLQFEVLSDVGNKVGKDFGVVYKLTDEVAARYQKGFDMHSYNGDESDELPLAATYVIAQDGTIVYAFLDAEYRNRAEPAHIMAALAKLK